MHITSESNQELTVKGTKDEIQNLMAALLGCCAVTQTTGTLHRLDTRHKIKTKSDPDMEAFWPQIDEGETEVKGYFHTPVKVTSSKTPVPMDTEHVGIWVSHIGGYGVDPETREARERKLALWGFVPMRSPRGPEGRYWEVWYLPGAWAAEGDLKGLNTHQILRAVGSGIRPGTIDLTRQHMGLAID